MKNTFKAVSVLATILGIIALSAILDGWVLSIIWKWFFVSTLNLPIINVPQAIGIALVVGFLTKETNSKKDNSLGEILLLIFFRPFLVLFIAGVVTLFM